MTSCTGNVRGGLRGFEKVSELSFYLRRRRLTFGARRGLAAGAARGGGGGGQMEKVSIERLCLSLSLCRKTF